MLRVLAAAAGLLATAVAALTVATALAVPCGPTNCAQISSATPGSRVLLVRPNGQLGPLVTYDLTSGSVRARLSPGILSADGKRFLTAKHDLGANQVERFDAATGKRLGSMTLGGPDLKLGAVSSDGRYAALVDGGTDPTVTIADVSSGTVARRIQLRGRWDVDALSRDGRRLYLIEYRGQSYNVRVHDAARGLLAGAITDPNEPEPMTGYPWASIGTPDGSRQLTLYLKTYADKVEPFVHSLSLTSEQADCIDLPGGEFMASGRYALVLARDGHTLYAANPSLGTVVTIDLRSRAAATIRFRGRPADNRTSAAFGALSPDGKTLVFSAGRGVFAYDIPTRKVRGPYGTVAVAGIGFAPSGRTLLVVRTDGSTVRLDATTGAKIAA